MNDVTHLNSIDKLLKFFSSNPDFDKSIIPKIIENVMTKGLQPPNGTTGLDCIEYCLKTYGSTCENIKKKLENYLLGFIDISDSANLQKKIGRCLHYLQQAGRAGTDRTNHINNWSTELAKLCKTLHKLYDTFFENISEFEDFDTFDALPHDFVTLPTALPKGDILNIISKRVHNIVVFIRAFLETSYPTTKNVPIQGLLGIIKRVLSVHCTSKSASIDSQFASLIIGHQKDILYLMRSLVACLQHNLLPFGFIITKLFMDVLNREHICDDVDILCEYNKALHLCFGFWISIARANINYTFHDKLVLYLTHKIQPVKKNVTLNLNTNISQHKSAKARKRAMRDQIISYGKPIENLQQSFDTSSLNKLELDCIYALELLSVLLKNVPLKLHRKNVMQLYDTILKTLISIQEGKAEVPYTNVNVSAKLYAVLASLIKQPTNNMAPIQICLRLFNVGLQTKNSEIQSICQEGIKFVELICQPMCASLYSKNFIVSETEDSNLDEMNDKLNNGDEILLEDDIQVDLVSDDEDQPTIVQNGSAEKVKILEVVVIKPQTNQNGIHLKDESVANISTINVESDSSVLEITDLTYDKENEAQEKSDDTDCHTNEKVITGLDSSDKIEENLVNKMDVDDNVSGTMEKTIESDTKECELDIGDASTKKVNHSPKKRKIDLEADPEYDDMLNSFVDVVKE